MTTTLKEHFIAKEDANQPIFQITTNDTMETGNFIAVYDLIECIVEVEAGDARLKNDRDRFELFKKAFINDGDEQAVKDYVSLIQNYINIEHEEYQKAILVIVEVSKIDPTIMEKTIAEQMDTREQIILYGNQFSMSSPVIDTSSLTKDSMIENYLSALDFARNTLSKNNAL